MFVYFCLRWESISILKGTIIKFMGGWNTLEVEGDEL